MDLPIEKVHLFTFLQIVYDIQRGFVFDYGLFMRGGVYKGSFLIKENSIHGQTLIDCVSMEENAKFPGILVSDSILNVIIKEQFYISEQDKYIDVLLQKSDYGEKLTESEKLKINEYVQSLKMEIYVRNRYE